MGVDDAQDEATRYIVAVNNNVACITGGVTWGALPRPTRTCETGWLVRA